MLASFVVSAAAIGSNGPGVLSAQTVKFYDDVTCTRLTKAVTNKVKQCVVTSSTSSMFISNTTVVSTNKDHFAYVTETWDNAACSGSPATTTSEMTGQCTAVQATNPTEWRNVNQYTESLQTMIAAAYTDDKCTIQTSSPMYLHTENALGVCDALWNSNIPNTGFKVYYDDVVHLASLEVYVGSKECFGTPLKMEALVDVCTPLTDATLAAAVGCATADACWVNVFPQGPMTANGGVGIGSVGTLVLGAAVAAALIIA